MTSPITCASVACAACSAFRNFARAAGSVSLVKGNAASVKVSTKRRRVGYGPQPMVAPVAVRDRDARAVSVRRLQGSDDVSSRIGVEREDGAEVAAARLEQLIAVVLRRGAGVLVGEDAAGAELLQLDQREKAAHRPHSAGAQPVLDRVQVDRRAPVPPENPVAQPLVQKPLGADVAVVLWAVTRML